MTVREFTVSPSGWNNTTSFRAECKKISDSLKGVGLVQTADTGQIDWATVTAVNSTDALQGYEIFRLGDGSGGLPIIYLRVEYRTSNFTSTYPGFSIQSASGTDGAGNLTGVVSYRGASGGSTSFALNAAQNGCQASSDGSTYFWLNLCDNWVGQSIPLYIFVIDRARNADGSASPDGWIQTYQRQGTTNPATKHTNDRHMNLKAGMSSSTHTEPLQSCAFYGNFSTLLLGNDMYFYPHYFANPMVYSASPVMLGCMASEITYGTKPVVNVYGVDRTFFSMGNRAGRWSMRNDDNHGVMLRWDV